jgi:hypothetical protein
MTLVTRAGKGAPLSAVDHDGNLTHVMDRANHTGTQAIATVTDLQAMLDAKAALASLSELIDDRVAALLVPGANVTLTYDDGAGTLIVAAAAVAAVTSRSPQAPAPRSETRQPSPICMSIPPTRCCISRQGHWSRMAGWTT